MALGIIGTALAGFAEGVGKTGGEYFMRSQLAEEAAKAQELRDERMNEFQRARDVSTNEMAKKREIDADTRKRAPGMLAEANARGIIASRLHGVNQEATDEAAALAGGAAPIKAKTRLSDREEASIRADSLAAEGEMESAHRIRQDVRDIDRIAADERRSDKSLASHERLSQLMNERIVAEGKLNRDQQADLARERMAELAAQFKNQGLSLQSTEKGMFIVDSKDKSVTPLMFEGKQLKSLKDDDGFKTLAAIGNLAKASADVGDMETSKMYLGMAKNVLESRSKEGESPKKPMRPLANFDNPSAEPRRGAPPAREPASPMPDLESGVSNFGPLTSWSTVEKAVRAGDPAAIAYARKRIAAGPGIVGIQPPESLIQLLSAGT